MGVGPPGLPLGALRQPREAAEGPKSHMVVFYDGKGLYQPASPVDPSEEPQVSSFRTLSWTFPGAERGRRKMRRWSQDRLEQLGMDPRQ